LKVYKYHTTTSTNDVLKDMVRQNDACHFTTVWALHQSAGRGQRGNVWKTELGKNLTFSILIALDAFEANRSFELNQLVSLAVWDVLIQYLPHVSIKWPNDILADGHKIAGILIENTVQGKFVKYSVVGIGLNVNQIHFEPELTNVTSLKKILQQDFDLEALLMEIGNALKMRILQYQNGLINQIWQNYTDQLYGWKVVKKYMNTQDEILEAAIIGISNEGKIQLQTSEQVIRYYDFKEVRLLYE
jgi:BirA family biotin operon repressor/biotin-[acetyl-CoA-carboxylase] ligase